MKSNEFLTESTLIRFLLDELDSSGVCNKALKPYRFRPDFVSHSYKVAVEFDGYLHYTKAKTILDDSNKDKVLKELGYSVVRVPYFVQMDTRVMKHLFGEWIPNQFNLSNYPHGFIDDKAILPADFCSLGIKRFELDLEKFDFIRDEILESLKQKNLPYHQVFYTQ